jgi:hypothetical protein
MKNVMTRKCCRIIIDDFNRFGWASSLEVPVAHENLKEVTDREIQDSGILLAISDVAEYIRQKYIDKAMDIKPWDSDVRNMAYKDFVSCVLDRAVESYWSIPVPQMSSEEVVDFLSCYAYRGIVKRESFVETFTVSLHNMEATVNSEGVVSISVVSVLGKSAFRFKSFRNVTQHHLRAIALLDAVMDDLNHRLDSIMLQVEAVYKSQCIYLTFADHVAGFLTEKYSGKTKVCYKPNRMTVHFYLSEKDKAFITFFRDDIPWTIPEPPTDPESLRMICSHKNTPFTIVSLSNNDRRYLKK